MQEVVRQLSEQLVARGHEVTVATSRHKGRTAQLRNGVKIVDFTISGSSVTGITGESGAYRDFLLSANFDVVTNFAAQQWATDIMLPILDQVKGVKVFVPTGFSGLYDKSYHEYFELMPTWLAKYDMNVFLSNDYRDINFARAHGVKNIRVIPNGASAEEFMACRPGEARLALGIPLDHFLVLHVGSHTGQKGHADAIQIYSSARLQKATLLIVGNSCDNGCAVICSLKARLFNLLPQNLLARKRLIVKELTRQLTVAAYHDADLFLFPSNIECSPLVLFECMAARTPFLSTDVGNSLEIAGWSSSGIIVPTTKDLHGSSMAELTGSIKILEQLYHDVQARRIMAENGFEAWHKRFTWEGISQRYEELYAELTQNTSFVLSSPK
jgi:glycosyltransferase involved in cell wall biosynthesis